MTCECLNRTTRPLWRTHLAARSCCDNSLRRDRPNISRSRADHAPGLLLFHGVGEPGRAARHGEYRRKRLARQPNGVEQQRRIHLDIGLDTASGLAALQGGNRAALNIHDESKTFRLRIELAQRRAQQVSTRIAMAKNAVAETHETTAGIELALDPAAGVTAGLDLIEHIECETRRTAMERTAERAVAAKRGSSKRC